MHFLPGKKKKKKKFSAHLNAYFHKRGIVSNLSFHFRSLEKEEQNKFKVSRRKETIKIRTETGELGNRKIIEENQQDQKLVL